MNNFFVALLGALLATNAPFAVSNLVAQQTGVSINVPDPNDPVEKEYHKLTAEDDDAHAEVDQWIRESQESARKGIKGPAELVGFRVKARVAPVRAGYEDFLARHPNHARARIAFGSFLNDHGEEEAAIDQWEKAREAEPGIPSTWNNLANFYGHHGPVKKAFEYYAKAMELDSKQAVYFWNLATTVYMFRKDAMEYYHLDETQVFDKALDLYRQAMKRDPANFVLSSDYAESFYLTKPPRWKEGLAAWEDSLKLAPTELEREAVRLHLARIKTRLGNFDEAQQELNVVTNEECLALKRKLQSNIDAARTGSTNPPVHPNSPPLATPVPSGSK